jgi:hypothetical protein
MIALLIIYQWRLEMREFFADSLHIFIVFMIFVLGIGGALIAGGKFDGWGKRLTWRRKKKKMDSH